MDKLVIAAVPYSNFVKVCAFETPICDDPGVEVELFQAMAKMFNRSLTLIRANDWKSADNGSSFSLVQAGLADTSQSSLFDADAANRFKLSWPLLYTAIYPVIKKPDRFYTTSYDFSQSCTLYVWFALIATGIICFVLKKLCSHPTIQSFPIRDVYHFPLLMFAILITILLNLFSNNLSIVLAYPPQPHLPFTTLSELKTALLDKRYTFVDVDNHFYLSLLGFDDLLPDIDVVYTNQTDPSQAGVIVARDHSSVSIVIQNLISGVNEAGEYPFSLCKKVQIIRDRSYPTWNFGYVFNRQNPSWLYYQLNYTTSSALFATFNAGSQRRADKFNGQFCFSNHQPTNSEVQEISIPKSRGMFMVLGAGCLCSLTTLLWEFIARRLCNDFHSWEFM